MLDAVHVSDLHLGSNVCRAEDLEKFFLELPPARRLVLGGDVLESTLARLPRRHWRVLSALRRLSDETEVVWVAGNHDHDAEPVAHLVGARFCEKEYFYLAGQSGVLTVHGDCWDEFIRARPFLTWAADCFYAGARSLSPALAVRLKHSSKAYLRCADRVRESALRYAASLHCQAVVCGHTHRAEGGDPGEPGPRYLNTGCWTEPDAHYVVVEGGRAELRRWDG